MAVHPVTWKVRTGSAVEGGYPILFDTSSELTKESNRLWRQCQNYKVGKFTITVDTQTELYSEVHVSGVLRYLKPTKGRISAIKKARRQWLKALGNDGIRQSKYSDFRILPQPRGNYANASNGLYLQEYPQVPNLCTLDGSNRLVCFGGQNAGVQVFTAHNAGLQQIAPTNSNMFQEGLTSRIDLVGGGDTDFVLDEEVLLTQSPWHADTTYVEIPFTASYDEASGTVTAEITPDPNAYFSILNGWFEIYFDSEDTETDGSQPPLNPIADQFEMSVSAHVIGTISHYRKRKRSPFKGRLMKPKYKRMAKKAAKTAYKGYRTYRRYRR